MAGWTNHDLGSFIDSDFGETIVYTPQFGATSSITGIFDTTYTVQLDSFGGVSSAGPAVTVLSSDVTGVILNEKITVSGVIYYIAEIMPDGDGITVLRLSKDPVK